MALLSQTEKIFTGGAVLQYFDRFLKNWPKNEKTQDIGV